MNMAKKVMIKCSDGKVLEADMRAMMTYSGLLQTAIEINAINGSDAPIHVQNVDSSVMEQIIAFCQRLYASGWPSLQDPMIFANSSHLEIEDERSREASMDRTERFVIANDRETHEDKRSWIEKECDADFVNEICSKFDWETIKLLHEAAKYLDIKRLLVLTETLICQAPSRAFMGIVSPWVDYNSLKRYQIEVEVA